MGRDTQPGIEKGREGGREGGEETYLQFALRDTCDAAVDLIRPAPAPAAVTCVLSGEHQGSKEEAEGGREEGGREGGA